MLNWVKIRVWEQEQWDGVIMIDVDVTVLGDLTHLFKLPTDFAAVPDNGKVWNRYTCIFCTGSQQPKGALHMHCKLGLPACSESQLQVFRLLCCAHAYAYLGKISGKARGRFNFSDPPYGVCLLCMSQFSKIDM